MRYLTLVVAVTLIPAMELRAEDAAPQEIKWNVFLSDWHLFGPFPKEDDTGLKTQYVPNESTLSTGQVHFYKNQLYTWQRFADRVIDFRKELGVNGAKGENKVAYAWTQFSSPVAQKVKMGVAYDDTFIGWLNGTEVARGTDNWASSLDQEVVEVNLQAGVNTLLMRVGNGQTKWDAAVRFFPAGLDKPLFTFKATPASNNVRLPVVDVAMLDVRRQVISEHQCSGARQAYPGIPGYYAFYAKMPDPVPSFVKLTVREPNFQEFETVASWDRIQTGNATVQLLSDRPAALLVVDKLTRKPVAGAQIWSTQEMAEPTTAADGKVSLPDVNAMSDRLYVVAQGYEAATVNLKWPRGAMQRVELLKGGRTLTGTIVSTTGEPLPGAKVTSGLSGYSPTAITDEKGEFEIYGLPKGRTNLYPVVEAPGFVTKGRFSFQLTGDETNVKWELAPGATITGQVVHQETGQPVPGITLTVGDSRFSGSNDKAPTTTTDQDGRYRLIGVTEGQNLVHAFSDNYAPEMKAVSVSVGKETTADFTVKPGKPVTGTITDTEGKPLVGVWLVTDTWNGVRMFRREDRTDAEGKFTLAHMPDSITEVDILKTGFISNRNFKMRGGDTFDLVMKPVITHTITVRDAADGKIVPDLQIAKGYLWEGNSTWNWRTDEYETTRHYDKLKGVMNIEIGEPFNYQIAYRFRATGFREQIVNIPHEATVGKEFEVELTPASVFSGRVVDAASGKPLPGIAVAIVTPEDQMRPDYYGDYTTPWKFLEMKRFSGQHTITDATGGFRLSPPSGKSGLSIVLSSPEGGFHLINDLDSVLTSSGLHQSVLELPMPGHGSIEGRVTIAGKPLANTKVRLSWMGYDGAANQGNQSFGYGGQVTTDANGFYRYENVGPGNYQLSRVFNFALGQGSSMSTYIGTQNLVLQPGQSLTHDLSRAVGVSLSGVARDAEGHAVSNAIVKVNVSGNNSRQIDATTSSVDGSFIFEHLAPGTYDVTAQHYSRSERGYSEQDMQGSTTVELADNKTDVTIELASIQRQTAPLVTVTRITGTLSPDITVTPVGADKPFTLSDHFGKVTAICFWASWANDATTIASTFEKFKGNPDVKILTIFLQDEEQLRAYEKQRQVEIDFPVATTAPNVPGQIMSVFGNTGQTGCFVIGRDGRFAAEQTTASQLATTIERALSQEPKIDQAAAKSSRLAVTLSVDSSDRGVNGAQLALKAFGAEGTVIYEDSYVLNGVPKKITWRYPNIADGGRLEVTLNGKGIEARTEIINSPGTDQQLTMDIVSPRVVSGRIVTAADANPVAGMQVRLQMYGGEMLTAESNAEGEFSVRCFPGSYYTLAVGNEKFAAETSSARTVIVPVDADPEPIVLKAVPAVTLQGRVVDQSGKPVAGASVTSQGGTTATSDSEGVFTLTGIMSVGTSQVWAMSGAVYGAIRLTSPDVEKTHTITLGQGLDSNATTASGLIIGSEVSEFDLVTLDGEQIKWQPHAGSARLLVFCALWHPSSQEFLKKARAWSEENRTPIELISLDWNLEQARREAGSLKLTERIWFAGPGQLSLDPQWSLSSGRGAFLVSSDGKLIERPLD